jgi:alpha-L-rhamnosidase-like protein
MRRALVILLALLSSHPIAWSEENADSPNSDQETSMLSDSHHRWTLGVHPGRGVTHFGLDSEGTGREKTNLLAGPVKLAFSGADTAAARWQVDKDQVWTCSIPTKDRKGTLKWTILREGEDLLWRVTYEGNGTIRGLRLELPFDALMGAAVLIPAALNANGYGEGPWLLIVPDFGHLRIDANPSGGWTAVNNGRRGGGGGPAPASGVDPRLRGQAWLDAVKTPGYRPGQLALQFHAEQLAAGSELKLRFRPRELSTPEGIDPAAWKRIRRAYLNNWQPCGTWAEPEKTWVLANNVLSNPASISLWFYADPMLFCREPVSGIDLDVLLRRSLDFHLSHNVSSKGHVNAFGKMHDLYLSTGPSLIIAAWDYWTISQDVNWLRKRIEVLHRMGDYVLRRDVDKDGLVESYGGGNAGTLRDPGRADIWFESMNFGHKNAWTNALSYRAFLCLAEMLEATGHPKGAEYYRHHASRLREAYVRQLLSPENGWFVSWVSEDGQTHDYCHTFVNGMAVAYGIVDPVQGKEILSRVVAKSKSIGFTNWHLGVPANLIPCRREDMIGPRIGLDGQPVYIHYTPPWPDELTEEKAFGYRYPNGTIHPTLVWPYLLGLQVAGLDEEADRILNAMIGSAQEGLFQNGIVNMGTGGAEHFFINGNTCGYEGFLPESYNFLMGAFTRDPAMRVRLLGPMSKTTQHK